MTEGPTWLGIGAQRCGTTWFADMLTQHPLMDVAGEKKEHHFLYHYGLTKAWDADARAQYRAMFSSPDEMLGEWTPYYLRASWIVDIVADAIPEDAPILVLVRDPIDRFASALRHEIDGAGKRYRKMQKSQGVSGKIPIKRLARLTAQARVKGPTKAPEEAITDRTWLRFVGSDVTWGGMFAAQLEMWTKSLPEERFMVMQYEKLRRDPQHYADLVWKRLGLDPVPLEDIDRPSRSSSKSGWVPDDYPHVVRALQKIYRPDAERLASRFDIDLELWKRTMS